MKATNLEPTPALWELYSAFKYRIFDWIIMILGVLLCFMICRISIGNSMPFVIWFLVLCFYFFFYRRLVQVIYWSWNTFGFLKKSTLIKNDIDTHSSFLENPGHLPLFHILISSYKASGSIIPVIKAIANQDYPADHFHVWIITEHMEQLEKQKLREKLFKKTQDFKAGINQDENLLPFFWYCKNREFSSLETWVDQVTSGELQSYLSYPESGSLILENLCSRLLLIPDRNSVYSSGKLNPLKLHHREIATIENALQRIREKVSRVNHDLTRLLGKEDIYQQQDLEIMFISRAIRKPKLKKIGKQLVQRLTPSEKQNIIKPNVNDLEKNATDIYLSTQEAIHQSIKELPCINLHHLDPSNRGFKPGALNVAYREIMKNKLAEDVKNTYFVVIDSDSLLPAPSLRTIAQEISKKQPSQAILQMASIPTANFFSEGWFSKFIAFADGIGALGKWARSTRRQLKPDLHAGSGVVIPSALLHFITQKTENPWDTSTLTEDARMIIGRFGMMNAAKNKTKMAPIYLLEAVPGELSFWNTYRAFWNQRRRWTTGGYDEFFYMLTCPRWLRHTRFNWLLHQWENYQPNIWERVIIRLRQFRRLYLWVWDHFLWGIGGFIILTHWWLISMIVVPPSESIRWIGFVGLLLSPLLFLMTSARQLSWFIPGGLTIGRKCLLYFQSFVAIWFYVLPVVVTQCACILGFRAKFIAWKPTRKPQYQFGRALDLEE